MAEIKTFNCPSCGAPLTVQGSASTMRCSYCGESVVVPEALRERPEPAPSPAMMFPVMAIPAQPQPAASEPERRSRSRPIGCGSIVVIVAIIAVFVLASALGLGKDGKATSGLAALKPTSTALPILRQLQATLPRLARYGGITYTITGGQIDNQAQQDGATINLEDGAFARLKVGLQNTTRENIYLDTNLFKLHLKDGKDYPLDPNLILDNSFTAPGPLSNGETSFIFQVPKDAQWDQAQLVIGAPGAEQASIPLFGDPPQQAFPQPVQPAAPVKLSSQGLDYELRDIVLDLDSGTQRADQGKNFIMLDFRIANNTIKYGANVSGSNFRLLVDGASLEPKSAPIEVIDYNSTLDGQVVFLIPAGTKTVTLQVGDVTSDQGELGKADLDLSR